MSLSPAPTRGGAAPPLGVVSVQEGPPLLVDLASGGKQQLPTAGTAANGRDSITEGKGSGHACPSGCCREAACPGPGLVDKQERSRWAAGGAGPARRSHHGGASRCCSVMLRPCPPAPPSRQPTAASRPPPAAPRWAACRPPTWWGCSRGGASGCWWGSRAAASRWWTRRAGGYWTS